MIGYFAFVQHLLTITFTFSRSYVPYYLVIKQFLWLLVIIYEYYNVRVNNFDMAVKNCAKKKF
jgi:hypothetical protein